ncbi:50S ribosomal protein L4 [bacterium]|nr:50S ribosomal protein L4 [bacterium]
MELNVYKIDGKPSGEKVKLPKEIFGIEPNTHAMYLGVVTEMWNRRQGTNKAKNRSDVRGGGRKPWRQKGRGTARAGTIRSPLWVGGGRVFGPLPRTYHKQLNKKLKTLARKSALAQRAREDKIRVVEDFSFESPKTKQMQEMITKLELNNSKILLLVPDNDQNIWLSGRNIPAVDVKEAKNFSTADVLNAELLLIQKSAISKLSEVFKK